MALVKSSDIEFELPLLTITADGERWNCRRLSDLTRVAPSQLKAGKFLGMEIIEDSGRRWVVRSIRKIDRPERWHILNMLLFSPRDWRVEYMLEELPPAPGRSDGAPRESSKRAPGPAREPTGAEIATVKASETDLAFPLVGFTKAAGALCFGDLGYLLSCDPEYVRDETLIGMELFDNRQRRWIVRSLLLKEALPKKTPVAVEHPLRNVRPRTRGNGSDQFGRGQVPPARGVGIGGLRR
nr:hypothetical protein [Sphingomonas sp. Y57]